MRFHIIIEHDKKHIVWIGKYTYGCCNIRGTFINLFKSAGNFLCVEENEEPTENYIFNNDNFQFRTDDSFYRIKGFDLESQIKDLWSKYDFKDYDFKYEEDKEEILPYKKSNNLWVDEEHYKFLVMNIDFQLVYEELKEVERYAIHNNVVIDYV